MAEKQLSERFRRGGQEIAKDTKYLANRAKQALLERLSGLVPSDLEQRVLQRGYLGGKAGRSGDALIDLPYLYYAGKRGLRNLKNNSSRYQVDKLKMEVAKLQALKQQRRELHALEAKKKRLEEELANLKG